VLFARIEQAKSPVLKGVFHMAKIAFVGAGSWVFTRNLARDILTFPLLRCSTLTLMDINAERLEYARQAVQRIVDAGHYPTQVETTMDRAEALRGADAVICTVLVGGIDVWRREVELQMQYGVDINNGDTRGPSGIFRALRTIPLMLDICRDIERHCPEAYLLNYTNPMAMLCGAMQRETSVRVTGLCHSVQGTAKMLARWIGAPMDEITYTCAGINHQAWYIKYEWQGRDAYPLIRRAIKENPAIYEEEIVRNEMFLHLDYYVTESSGHNSEYNPWFRKRPDLVEKYCNRGTSWNPGVHMFNVRRYEEMGRTWREEFAKDSAITLERGEEYAACIINALLGGEPFEFNGNVPNTGLVTNLPAGVCVEVPVFASRKGLSPVFVGALPPQCALLTGLNASIEEMAVEAALTGNPRLVFQAIAHDPLTAAVLSLAEIEEMVNAMFQINRDCLPTFKHFEVD